MSIHHKVFNSFLSCYLVIYFVYNYIHFIIHNCSMITKTNINDRQKKKRKEVYIFGLFYFLLMALLLLCRNNLEWHDPPGGLCIHALFLVPKRLDWIPESRPSMPMVTWSLAGRLSTSHWPIYPRIFWRQIPLCYGFFVLIQTVFPTTITTGGFQWLPVRLISAYICFILMITDPTVA